MTSQVVPFQDLAHRIEQQQAELEKLRHEYESHQTRWRQLQQRRTDLQAKLAEVEAELQGVAPGLPVAAAKPAAGTSPKPASAAAPKPAAAAKPSPSPASPPKSAGKQGTTSLPEMLVRLVTEAGKPITVKELTVSLQRRRYPTKSKKLQQMVENRVSTLVRKGMLRRSVNPPGVVPATAKVAAAKPAAAAAPASKPKAAAPTNPASNGRPSLSEMVTKALAGQREPLTAQQLADKVLAAGYETKSKDFKEVIWGGISKMTNVENVPGKGYRLKASAKSKGAK